MECNIVDQVQRVGTPMHIHIYSDIHGKWDRVLPHMAERAKLPNSRFILLGDNDDWILAKDPRYQASKIPKDMLGVDDYIDASVEQQYERLKGFDFLFVSQGNHDFEMLNRHATSPTARLARKLGCLWGGWSGFLKIRFRSMGSKQIKAAFTLLYHHGGAAGAVTKGMPWAQRFAAGWEGWDVFAFGHTHQLWCDHSSYGYMSKRGRLRKQDRWIVNTGTWLESYEEGGSPTYGERKGYKPVAIAAPTIQVTPLRNNQARVRVTLGNG
jgi:predicted phosphodiesterase